MSEKLPLYGLFFILSVIILESCSNTRFLTGDQLLYTGRKTIIISDSGKFNDGHIKQLVASVTSFKPNNSLGGKRVLPPLGLWIFNYMKPPENKKSPGWLYRTFSREPVLVSKVTPLVRCQKLESELFSKGYFHSSVRAGIDTSRKNPHKAGIIYYIKPDKPFRYHDISFVPPKDAIDTIINSFKDNLALKPNDIFDLEIIKSETNRITARLLEEGYFNFNPTYVKWMADTTLIPWHIDLKIAKNEDIPQDACRKYSIDDITVRIMPQIDSLHPAQPEDTLSYNGMNLITTGDQIKPNVIFRAIYFRKGDLYSSVKQKETLNHLNSYGIYKYLNMQFVPDQDTLVPKLDMVIELTPVKNISLDLEANVVTKSTGFSGPGLAATLAHGNLGGGANRLQLRLNSGFEWQWSGNSSGSLGTMSYNFGLSSSIIFPQILQPFNLFKTGNFSYPQTTITLGWEFINKIQYYRMNSTNLGFGYQWKKSAKFTNTFYPIFFNSVNLIRTTPEFDSILYTNPYIRKSFEEQFIAGMKYDFIYDNAAKKPDGFYFQAGISSAGNLLDLIKKPSSASEERPYTFVGNVYSQFMKFSTDIRYYRNLRSMNFVLRFYSGIGLSYGNSVVMPYVEQFYSGGSNSIRAFIARSVGPGSLRPDETSEIIDQTGDIKLEANAEFRFKLLKVLYGALFLDAGNIWLLNKDESRPGAEFRFDSLADQLAVGTGVGLRFDFDFFVLRTDLGLPLRKAYKTNSSNWTGNLNEMFNGAVFNLAIGYPF